MIWLCYYNTSIFSYCWQEELLHKILELELNSLQSVFLWIFDMTDIWINTIISPVCFQAELLRDQASLRQLMGETEKEQRDRLAERLRRRKERLAQGRSSSLCKIFIGFTHIQYVWYWLASVCY